MSLADRFDARLRAACTEAKNAGAPPSRVEQMLERYRGVDLVDKLVRSGDIQPGLLEVTKLGRIDLSIEAIMLEPEFEPLFKNGELVSAKWRLQEVRRMLGQR